MSCASFQVDVNEADLDAFARLSGDWNPLHTDEEHARRHGYGRRVLHGAYSSALVSRLAGMHLPGSDCLLHSMRLRFIAPIIPPVTLHVSGRTTAESAAAGRVEATISDASTGAAYVDAAYEFSRQRPVDVQPELPRVPACGAADAAPILVTGATGGLGRAVLRRLGAGAHGVSRTAEPGCLEAPDAARLRAAIHGPIGGIVHCGWPAPDNQRLIALKDVGQSAAHHVTEPIEQIISLAQILAEHGTRDAMLVLVGSTAASPGRHSYRMPLYSLAKVLIPELTRILALELAPVEMRCAAVVYDVIDGGMNRRLSPTARLAHIDRVPAGRLPTPDDAAQQIAWLLENRSFLVSGATLTLSGAALP